MRILQTLILLLFLFIGSTLYGMIGMGRINIETILKPETLGRAIGLGMPTLIIFFVIGFFALFISKKVWVGILAATLIVIVFAGGSWELNTAENWFKQAVIGELAVVLSFLVWAKIGSKFSNRYKTW